MPDDPTTAALRAAAEAVCLARMGVAASNADIAAAAVCAFLRAMPCASVFIHGQALKTTNCLGTEELAAAVERAAREGAG